MGIKEMTEERAIYFFDTYALMEIINGNPNYQKYLDSGRIVLMFNLIELHFNLMKKAPEEKAREITLPYYKDMVPFSLIDVFEANTFRYANTKKKLSFTDCLGYLIAKKKGVKFITGDKEFQDMENVEFVR
jgi:predicted nucleic acid-binding protein